MELPQVKSTEGRMEDFRDVLKTPPAPPSYAETVSSNPQPISSVYDYDVTNEAIVDVSQSQVIIRDPEAMQKPDNVGAILYSCFVFWLCCWPLGLVAFYIALSVKDQPTARDAQTQMKASHIVSTVGVVCGTIIMLLSVMHFYMHLF